MDRRRSHGVQELQPKKVQPGFDGDHAEIVHWIACFIKYRKVDPREARPKPRTPDHIPYIELATAFQQRQSVFYAYHSVNALNTGICEILRFNTDERSGGETSGVVFGRLEWLTKECDGR